jgi:hypothetical protein
MKRPGRRAVFAHLAIVLALFANPCRADDTEQREFSIFVDGKESGSSRMTIVQKDDGTTYMTAAADVKFKHLVIIDYVIKIETQEWWKNGQLIGLKTTGTDNGKKIDVTIAPGNQQLRVRSNGKETAVKSEVWTNSFWKLADARFHNKQVPIVESDTGKEFTSDLKYVGMEKIPVGGQLQDCYRFQVPTTPSSGPIDLWYDKYHRLVRQEFTESGHKTIVQLNQVRR